MQRLGSLVVLALTFAPPALADSGLLLLQFDIRSKAAWGPFPISRAHYAEVVEAVEKGKPAAVVLKFFLDAQKDASADRQLVEVVARYGNVYSQAGIFPGEGTSSPGGLSEVANPDKASFPGAATVVLPFPQLGKALAGIGLVEAFDRGSRWQVVTPIAGRLYATLPLVLVARERGLDLKKASVVKGVKGWRLTLDTLSLALDDDGTIPLALGATKPPVYGMLAVAKGEVSASQFAGKTVLLFIDLPDFDDAWVVTAAGRMNKAALVADAIAAVRASLK